MLWGVNRDSENVAVVTAPFPENNFLSINGASSQVGIYPYQYHNYTTKTI